MNLSDTMEIDAPSPVPASNDGVVTIDPAVVTVTDPSSTAAEAIRGLRTQIQSQHLQLGRRALAICGVGAGHGCTFVATNLAVSLSQIGFSTLLIDANLRAPKIDRLIQKQGATRGLKACLESPDSLSVSAFIDSDALPNLSIMYAGGAAANAQELLSKDRFVGVMQTCLRTYDATIIDTAPANSSADGLRVANVVGYSLLVARKHVTLVSDIKVFAAQLHANRAKLIGTVLNEQ